MLLRPLERVVSHFLPALLTHDVVRPPLKLRVLNKTATTIAILHQNRRWHRGRLDMVFAPTDEK
jgi:hypothetical protein